MEELFFWKDWNRSYRRTYGIVLGFLALVLFFYLFHWATGEDALIRWETRSELKDVPVRLDAFQRGPFHLEVAANNYVITEQFVASDPVLHRLAGYLFLGMLAAGTVVGLTVITFLSRFRYVVAMAAFLLLLVGFRFELLAVFGRSDSTALAGLMVAYGGLSYYFHAFRMETSLSARLLIFALLTGLAAGGIGIFAQTGEPALHLANYGVVVPLVVALVFTFVVAAEIPYAFLYLVTQANHERSRHSFLHFTVASAVYALNLLLIYLENAGMLELNLSYIPPFLIYGISTVLGVWGGRQSSSYENAVPFVPFGALWYAALAIVSTATYGYVLATANDPLVEVLEDAVVYSHLAMGVTFFLYVVVNFGDLLQQNRKVYKVVYKPVRMPFFMARGFALLIVTALFFRADRVQYAQATAGYYNGLGDLSTTTKEYFLAEQYYKLGSQYGRNNHKSNYALASLARIQNDPIAAEFYLRRAILKHPTPYDYANLGNLLAEGNEFFEAFFALKEGMRKFPRSGELSNNLALLYNQTSLADSAFLFFDLAKQFAGRPEVAESNLMAFWAKNPDLGRPDSLLKITPSLGYLPFQNNWTVLQNQVGSRVRKELQPTFLRDSTLSRDAFAYLYNQAIGAATQPDTTLSRRIARLEQNPANALYAEDLAFARANYEYRFGNRGVAIQTLKNLSEQATDRADLFNRTLGAWLLQGGAHRLSAEYSAKASDPQARFNRAVALSEGGMTAAAAAWQQIVQLADSVRSDGQPLSSEYQAMKSLAREMRTVYEVTPDGLDDQKGGLFRRYRKDTSAGSLEETDVGARNREPPSGSADREGKEYRQALVVEKAGDVRQAEAWYRRALKSDPLNEELIVHAGRFFGDRLKNEEAAYNVLVEAVQLNPYSVPVYQAYVRQCLAMGLTGYAEAGLETLKTIATPADYQAFLPEYREKMALIEKQAAEFR